MKGKWITLALLCTLLLGCSPQSQTLSANNPRLSPTKQTENDNLRCYPLDGANCRFFVFGDSLCLYDPVGQTLRCYRGRNLLLDAQAQVTGIPVVGYAGIYCYDPEGENLVQYSEQLTPEETYPLPGCSGIPVIGETEIYYTTDTALMALEIRSGLRRLVRQQQGLALSVLLPELGMAACTWGEGNSFFLRLEDGAAVSDSPRILAATSIEERVLLCMRLGNYRCLYLGKTMLPLDAGWEFLRFLPDQNGVLLYQPEGKLGIYDLTTGNRMAELSLPEAGKPEEADILPDGRIFFRYGSALYGWQPETDPRQDSRVSIVPLVTSTTPDEKQLNQCRQRSAYLKNQYGAQVLLTEEVTEHLPAGVTVEPEYLKEYILDILTGMESALSRFPSELVRSALSGGGNTYLCPVRSIRVEGEERNFLQYWDGKDCYILLAGSEGTERDVVRAFFPLIWRKIVMKSDILDDWSEDIDGGILLYNSLQPGNREFFLDARMQSALNKLSAGIRSAFALTSPEAYLWEQYLWKSVPTDESPR